MNVFGQSIYFSEICKTKQCVNLGLFYISFRRIHYWFDTLYYMSSMGKQFKKNCDFVHKIADDVIKKRKQTLV